MRFRGLLPAAAATITVIGAIVVLFDAVNISGNEGESTFSLAPLSLGNPAAASTLRTWRLNRTDDSLVAGDAEDSRPSQPTSIFMTIVVKSGNTLSGLLTNSGLSLVEAAEAVQAFSEAFDPKRIRAGNEINLKFVSQQDNEERQFVGLEYEPTPLDLVSLARTDDGFTATREAKVLKVEQRHATGTIENSLYVAGMRAGLPVPVLIDLIHAYSWDVDFQRDIQVGDTFNVLYQSKKDPSGEVVAYGDILYAEINLSGVAMPVYRYTTSDGITDYFDDKGRSAKKALMRTPIDGAKLTSGFGTRKHPILGYNKMHKGLDFAAPSGTPIYAAGDGVIDFAGRNGAYGNYVRIRHSGEYATAYAHMKGFGKSIKKGVRVRQGQVIGYVGTTGRSTGPHLHFEVMKNSKQVNPMKVKMPSGLKLAGAEFKRFQGVAQSLLRQYAQLSGKQTVAQIIP